MKQAKKASCASCAPDGRASHERTWDYDTNSATWTCENCSAVTKRIVRTVKRTAAEQSQSDDLEALIQELAGKAQA